MCDAPTARLVASERQDRGFHGAEIALFITVCTSLTESALLKMRNSSITPRKDAKAANFDHVAGTIGSQIQSAASASHAVDIEGDGVGAVDESHRDVMPQSIVGDRACGK